MEFSQKEKIICNFFVEREGEEILKVIKKIDFIDEGILDSLDVVIHQINILHQLFLFVKLHWYQKNFFL